ncbi:MAG: mechanosensitive ion channel [Phormidesmis sp. RL_2_1]|nr:mechanosensitive ion channel [Phormidesmis sp. RL_2_1]
MDVQNIIQEIFQVPAEFQQELLAFGTKIATFSAALIGAWILARLAPFILKVGLERFAGKTLAPGYKQVINPIHQALVRSLFFGFAVLALALLRDYQGIYGFLNFFFYLAFSVCAGWFSSQLMYQVLQVYGVKVIRPFSHDTDDFVIVISNLANTVVTFFTIVYFAQTQNLNLISVLAGLGIVGLAISFAAKETFAQIIGSIVLYLDRPYMPGEYVRVSFNPKDEDVYGRIEAIGIRSTKIRVAAKNTLVIAPNSVMIKKDIENISRGTKVMSLLYLDFSRLLNDGERALVKNVVGDAIGNLLGVEPLSVKIFLFEPEGRPGTRARASFFC